MRTSSTPSLLLFVILVLIPVASALGKLPDGVVDSEETLTSSDLDLEPEVAFRSESENDDTEDVTAQDGPTPPSVVAAPLDPLPAMSVPLARPPGFGPPPSFKSQKDSGEHPEQANVGFVVRRGRARVMGFSRRKTD